MGGWERIPGWVRTRDPWWGGGTWGVGTTTRQRYDAVETLPNHLGGCRPNRLGGGSFFNHNALKGGCLRPTQSMFIS
eukprot:361764-Prorocentrum_minimum.AAC.2